MNDDMQTQSLFPEDQEKRDRSKMFGTSKFRQAYQKYINSAAWKKLSKQVSERAKHKCERCGSFSIRLSIHHLTYERFQNELLTDLQALCAPCHQLADEERAIQNRKKFKDAGEAARYKSARDAYMTKKYGDNWTVHCNEHEYQEFDQWIQRKRETEWL